MSEDSANNNPSNEQILDDRSLLIEQARSFLRSPAVHLENEQAKAAFLLDKGLSGQEINMLLRETHLVRLPPIPPRTYPPSPPSNLRLYVALLLRLTNWTAGIITILTFLYKRLLLGRITASLTARHQLILHQTNLLAHLQGHIKTLKDERRTTYKYLIVSKVVSNVSHLKSLQDIPVDSDGLPSLSMNQVVWATFQTSPDTSSFTIDEIVEQLERAFPKWLETQGSKQIKEHVVTELEASDLYSKTEEQDIEMWSLSTDLISFPDPEKSLIKLRDAICKGSRSENTYQYLFKSLTDFTAFLSREMFQFYTVDTAAFRRNLLGDTNLTPIQDELRREIRAMKGLVLNRRYFSPTPSKPPSFVSPPSQS